MRIVRLLIALPLILAAAAPAPRRPAQIAPPARAHQQPTVPARVISIWGGARSSMVLLSDGTVWNWGMNWHGKLGDGFSSVFSDPVNFAGGSHDHHTPIQVHGPGDVGYLTSISAIMAGESHSFALKSDGTVWAWGWNGLGQLGDGNFADSYVPVQVSGLYSITALGGRGYHSLALRSDGTVWAWGWNSAGQLGDGNVISTSVPVQVVGLTNAISVTSGYQHSLAMLANHTLVAWGNDGHGQLGDGSFNNSYTFVPVKGLTNVKQFSAGWDHNLALRSDGTVWAWGNNFSGELGQGFSATVGISVPVQVHVPGPGYEIAVSGGDFHCAALRSDGTVWTWGANFNGQIGDGTTTERTSPVQVVGLSNVVAIAARDHHNLALEADGSVWAWGWNINGQLGDNTTIDRNTPVEVIFGSTPFTPTAWLYLPLVRQ